MIKVLVHSKRKLFRKMGIHDIRDDRRWQLEAKQFGEGKATSRAMERLFQNEHYTRMRAGNEKREKWQDYLSHGVINDLVSTARDLFELIETESRGVIRFASGMKTWQEGIYMCVDFEGKGKKGYPISWYVKGSDKLRAHLYYSSDVESEIWRRLANKKGNITSSVDVFGSTIAPNTLNKYFEQFHRDFNSTYNFKPYRVESAFNHIPSLKRHLRVEGFPYPHKMSNIAFA